jgi:hypothetical protein
LGPVGRSEVLAPGYASPDNSGFDLSHHCGSNAPDSRRKCCSAEVGRLVPILLQKSGGVLESQRSEHASNTIPCGA